LFLGIAFFATSCSDSNDDIVETVWNIENPTINASQWSWSPANKRWEAVWQLAYINEFIYEKGAVIGYVFLGTQGQNEVQTQLPYLKSYQLDDGSEFTETISYEYSLLTNRVTFYIAPSDGIEDSAARATYNFRIAMIW
jgi:hypothetical protein